MIVRWLGRMAYQDALEEQLQAHAAVLAGGEDVLLGVEHPTVITLGVRGRRESDVFKTARDFDVVETDRGGQATLHNEGQLVIYPIVDLRRRGVSPREFVRLLLETSARVVREQGIACDVREDQAGVYTSQGKIGFCGLRIDRGVCRHGISLNVSNDLTAFSAIRPCGMSSESLTSIRRIDPSSKENPETLFKRWPVLSGLGLDTSPALTFAP